MGNTLLLYVANLFKLFQRFAVTWNNNAKIALTHNNFAASRLIMLYFIRTVVAAGLLGRLQQSTTAINQIVHRH